MVISAATEDKSLEAKHFMAEHSRHKPKNTIAKDINRLQHGVVITCKGVKEVPEYNKQTQLLPSGVTNTPADQGVPRTDSKIFLDPIGWLDMTEAEALKRLRIIELDVYAGVITALRAQGPLNAEKLKFIRDAGEALHIPEDRFKAEVRRVIFDEELNTIAYFAAGHVETCEEWINEARRLVPLVPRTAPHTVYSAVADEVADATAIDNDQLPLPVNTDRKRPISQPVIIDTKPQFRMPEPIKIDHAKKMKLTLGAENSTLAKHLITPQKIGRTQQLYRQKSKVKAKQLQFQTKMKKKKEFYQKQQALQQNRMHQQHLQLRAEKLPLSVQPTSNTRSTVNIMQNLSLQIPEKREETMLDPLASGSQSCSPQPGRSNENQAPRPKLPTMTVKTGPNVPYKRIASPGPSGEIQKPLKVCPTLNPIGKTPTGQKLILVSNAQSKASTSILQRTLTIPFVKNLSMKNFDKFKIITTAGSTTVVSNVTTMAGGPSKHKMVTVRTGPQTTKKVIPIAHLQALTAKGSIKMLPVGGKMFTKAPTATSSSSAPIYFMNSTGSIQQALTKSTTSTPMMVSSASNDLGESQIPVENEEAIKSSVLEDILKASGVTDSEETHASQVPENVPEEALVGVTETSTYSTSKTSTEQLIKDLEGDDSGDAMDTLDLGTGE